MVFLYLTEPVTGGSSAAWGWARAAFLGCGGLPCALPPPAAAGAAPGSRTQGGCGAGGLLPLGAVVSSRCFVPALSDAGAARAGVAAAPLPGQRRVGSVRGQAAAGGCVGPPGEPEAVAVGVRGSAAAAIRAVSEPAPVLR